MYQVYIYLYHTRVRVPGASLYEYGYGYHLYPGTRYLTKAVIYLLLYTYVHDLISVRTPTRARRDRKLDGTRAAVDS